MQTAFFVNLQTAGSSEAVNTAVGQFETERVNMKCLAFSAFTTGYLRLNGDWLKMQFAISWLYKCVSLCVCMCVFNTMLTVFETCPWSVWRGSRLAFIYLFSWKATLFLKTMSCLKSECRSKIKSIANTAERIMCSSAINCLSEKPRFQSSLKI